jgi:uncharacterized membrane protein
MSVDTADRTGATAGGAGRGATGGAAGGTAVRGAMTNPRAVRAPGGQEAEGVANLLGWFSVGLGVAEIVAPRSVSRIVGVRPSRRNHTVIQAMGVREIVKGVGILSRDRPRDWLWGRVAGDMLDVGLLGSTLRSSERRGRTTAAMGAVLGVAAVDALTAQALSSGRKLTRGRTEDDAIRVRRTVTVLVSPDEAYRFWSDFENLPRFMRHLDSVRPLGDRRSRWTMAGPGDTRLEWEVEIVEDRPGEVIAWRSAEEMPVSSSGSVHFRAAPVGRGTEVTLEVEYDPPLGVLGAALAKIFREEPGQQVRDDLRRFKQLMEVGEVLVSDGTLRRGPRPARPPEEPYHGNASPASPL